MKNGYGGFDDCHEYYERNKWAHTVQKIDQIICINGNIPDDEYTAVSDIGYGNFWSSTESSDSRAFLRTVYFDNSSWYNHWRNYEETMPLCVGD